MLESYLTGEPYDRYYGTFGIPDPITDLTSMIRIRLVEQKIADLKKNGFIVGPVHLGAGQEAIAVALSRSLIEGDKLFGGHRCHTHYLALTGDVEGLFSEFLNKSTGCSGGLGGSMHLCGKPMSSRFAYSNPIVSHTIPNALGYAFANRSSRALPTSIGCSVIGDGAVEEGVFYEVVNIAEIKRCPLLIVCENNLMASHLHISHRQKRGSIAHTLKARGIKTAVMNGNDVAMCAFVFKKLVEEVRSGQPCFVECFTYRHFGHVDYNNDIGVGEQRSNVDYKKWLAKDPITLFSAACIRESFLSAEQVSQIWADETQRVNAISNRVLANA